ncbi:trypsin-like peptidase domain-containing protein [Alteromonas facilis]|uniref:trypsin-like peptidase domain-containing protein n=1 Tax=Alteromonas facilis TaxID=2048004 RepID=UPI000C281E48|nr:trypsin-like peptidase domain-containing protein [Alteromonas facilis]
MISVFKRLSLIGALLLFATPIHADDLPRAVLLGVGPAQSDSSDGIAVGHVAPNSTAQSLGLQVGDQITHVNKQSVAQFSDLVDLIQGMHADDPITVSITREDQTLQLEGVMQPRPYEVSEIADVSYETVEFADNRLRAIVHTPKDRRANEVLPTVFYIQGYTCGSIDLGMTPNSSLSQLVNQLVEAGYIVFRVEKPGVGDSLSPRPCSAIDFTEESQAFVHALRSLKQREQVDPNRIYLWGHSLGVLHSAVMADQESVAGVVGYGGVYKPWYDYMLDIYSQQSVKHFNVSTAQAKRNTGIVKPFLNAWLNTSTPWQEVLDDPENQPALNSDLLPINGEQIFDRHYSFFRNMNGYDFQSMWKRIDAPVLMLHGSLDIQAITADWASAIADANGNSFSDSSIIKGAEHAFMRYGDAQQYASARSSGRFNPGNAGDRYDARVGEKTLEWIATLPKHSGKNQLSFYDKAHDKAFVGNGFVISHNDTLYAVTVKHALLEAKTPQMEHVSIEQAVQQWSLAQHQGSSDPIVLGKLLNADPNEPIDMSVLQRDWLVFELDQTQANTFLKPLTLRESTLSKNERLIAIGCTYATQNTCEQDTYAGHYVETEGNNLRVQMDSLDLATLRGLSGSPVLDSNGQVVGIVSNVLRSKTGEGFDFAPATTDYLMQVLSSLQDAS